MIGYLSVKKLDNRYIGGLLIVNERGIPVEFKYTDPIIPTGLQKIIYGSSLEEYLSSEIIGKGLLSKIENQPEFVLVDDQRLIIDKKTFLLNEVPGSRVQETENLLKINNRFFRVSGLENPASIVEKIKELTEKMDVLEPFDRLEKALNFVCESQET
ncbi:hypothetical protein JYK00_09005 [Thermosipho ferrireducens]|uniref:Uncharacterized protein n=1 Tax=Thermosipho ferrireducens TaxID=2571116 RepID=A0ABX7S925_9BACT|nr:hypothetical protein [Thermosipho ferrireducens]QTA37846.1 hypothetical protein JYK00_09005 [Thermosipho ferrireducens]